LEKAVLRDFFSAFRGIPAIEALAASAEHPHQPHNARRLIDDIVRHVIGGYDDRYSRIEFDLLLANLCITQGHAAYLKFAEELLTTRLADELMTRDVSDALLRFRLWLSLARCRLFQIQLLEGGGENEVEALTRGCTEAIEQASRLGATNSLGDHSRLVAMRALFHASTDIRDMTYKAQVAHMGIAVREMRVAFTLATAARDWRATLEAVWGIAYLEALRLAVTRVLSEPGLRQVWHSHQQALTFGLDQSSLVLIRELSDLVPDPGAGKTPVDSSPKAYFGILKELLLTMWRYMLNPPDDPSSLAARVSEVRPMYAQLLAAIRSGKPTRSSGH
jgi:hypothetical protein